MHARNPSPLRGPAAIGLVAVLLVGCTSAGPTNAPAGSQGVAVAPPSTAPNGSVVGAPEQRIPPTVSVPYPARASFDVIGDEINGWWWLRDPRGAQKASWAFFGKPAAGQITLQLELLATDRVNGGPGVDARFWLSYGPIVETASSPLGTPHLVVLPNTSPEGDPVGYTATGTYPIHSSDIPAGALGVWVRIGRLGPDGQVVPEHIAVREASVTITGLEGPAGTPAPSGEPPAATVSPDETALPGGGAYGPLTITTECQTWSSAPLTVTGSAAPDLHLQFGPDAAFSTVYASDDFVLAPPGYTYESLYGTAVFPDGIWVRWAAEPSITAHASNKGYCAGSTPPPTPTPEPSTTATLGPPEGTPTIVALGDSYISGEAGRWAGNTNDWYVLADAGGSSAYFDNAAGTAEVIAGCHRSGSAEVHIDRGGYGHVTTINLACSGATTQTRATAGGDKPGIDRCPNQADRDDCPAGVKGQVTMLQESAAVHNVKLVVLSIGGNDFEFADTVAQCGKDFVESSYVWKDYCHDDGSVEARFGESMVTAVNAYLVRAYGDIADAMRDAHYPDDHWSLLVQTYPGPLPPGGDIRYDQPGMRRFNNGCPFWNEDADWANDTALPVINDTINAAVAEFSDAYPSIDVHVMDVSQALIGHRLCEDTVGLVGTNEAVKRWSDPGASDGSEWVAQIRGIWSSGGMLPLPGSVYFKNESFHPNYWGQLALRDCLRQAWNGGNVRGGTCEFMQTGLNAFDEPTMILTQP